MLVAALGAGIPAAAPVQAVVTSETPLGSVLLLGESLGHGLGAGGDFQSSVSQAGSEFLGGMGSMDNSPLATWSSETDFHWLFPDTLSMPSSPDIPAISVSQEVPEPSSIALLFVAVLALLQHRQKAANSTGLRTLLRKAFGHAVRGYSRLLQGSSSIARRTLCMIAERFREVPLNGRGIGRLLTICRT